MTYIFLIQVSKLVASPLQLKLICFFCAVSHRWVKPNIPPPHPLPRRAHTAVLFRDTIYVFGGGNGHRALNDVWALDVSVPPDKLRWEQVPTHGTKPGARGYHTANLVGEVMVVLGGSDGRECFSDVWVLDLGEAECPNEVYTSTSDRFFWLVREIGVEGSQA